MVRSDVLRTFQKNNISAFEVMTGLDIDCDVILKDCDLMGFVEFCHSINKNIVFYQFLDLELEDYIVDEDNIRNSIKEIIEDKLEDNCYDEPLTVSDFDDEINKKMHAIHQHNIEVKKRVTALKQVEILFASIYVIYDGMQVGIKLDNDYMDDYPMAFEIEENLEADVLGLIEDKLSMYEIDDASRFERWEMEREQKRIEEKEKRDKALDEICNFVTNDISLRNCTNQKLRHAYSKQIAEEYSEKYGVLITIGSAEAVVEEIYRKLK